MSVNDTNRLRAIRRELCDMQPGEERTIANRKVVRHSESLDGFELIGLDLPLQDLGTAEQLLSDPRLASRYKG